MPAVSVIVPVHNAERHLRESLDSILGQTFADFEVIVVDDGSTDGSRRILDEYAASDPRVTVLPGPAVGSAGAARNAGLQVATGSYLSFLDSDDVFAPTLLAQLHAKAVSHDADVVLSKFRQFNRATREAATAEWSLRIECLPRKRPFAPTQAADHLFYAVSPATWNKLFRTAFVHEKGLRFQHLRRTNDAYFTLLALAQAERISYVDRALVYYRTGNPGSLQATLDESPLEFVEALDAIRGRLKEAGLYTTFERAFVNQVLMTCLSNLKRQTTHPGFRTVYDAVRGDVLQRFEVLGRPSAYFLRPDLARKLNEILTLTPEEYLFRRFREAAQATEMAQADARRALHEVDMRGASTPPGPPRIIAAVPAAPDRAVADRGGRPDVSVIVPVHNTELFLRECLDSVLRQSDVNLEIVCVDDGSTDGSGPMLDEYAAREDRVQVIRQANSGLSGARNTGLAAAAGRYICFLDSDDFWQLDGVAELVRQADASELDVLLFDAVSVREPDVDDALWRRYREYYQRRPHAGVKAGVEMVADLVEANEYLPSACLYLAKREVIADLRFYPRIRHEDNLFTFRLMLAADRVAHAQQALYARRVRPGSIISTLDHAAAARGYFITCVEMFRSLRTAAMSDRAAAAIGDLAYRAFRGARNNAVALPEELVERFREVDPAPDAQALFFLLRRAWLEERRARQQTKRSKLAATSGGGLRPGWRRHPLVVAIKPYAKRLLGRT